MGADVASISTVLVAVTVVDASGVLRAEVTTKVAVVVNVVEGVGAFTVVVIFAVFVVVL